MPINMSEYFTRPFIFALHRACDAIYNLENFSTPFQMKNVEENVSYSESPSSIINPSRLPFCSGKPSTVCVLKQQLDHLGPVSGRPSWRFQAMQRLIVVNPTIIGGAGNKTMVLGPPLCYDEVWS